LYARNMKGIMECTLGDTFMFKQCSCKNQGPQMCTV
jgi:hypothetical protein